MRMAQIARQLHLPAGWMPTIALTAAALLALT